MKMNSNKWLMWVLFPIILLVGLYLVIKFFASRTGRASSPIGKAFSAVVDTVAPLVPTGGNSGQTLGDRTNNPGCIRYNAANNWQGQTGSSGGFCVFDTKVNGLRAIMKIFKTYLNSGTNTVAKILQRYAPSHENNTDAYIAFVANKLGMADGNVAIEWKQQTIMNLVRAIALYESKYEATDEELLEAWRLAQ